MMELMPWLLFGGTAILLAVSLYFNYKFGLIIIKMQDAISVALDQLDERYRSISSILEIPLFYDSPQIRKVVQDIKFCRDSILQVANQIADIEETPYGEEEDQETPFGA